MEYIKCTTLNFPYNARNFFNEIYYYRAKEIPESTLVLSACVQFKLIHIILCTACAPKKQLKTSQTSSLNSGNTAKLKSCAAGSGSSITWECQQHPAAVQFESQSQSQSLESFVGVTVAVAVAVAKS